MCGGSLKVRDTKPRHIISKDSNEVKWYRLRRLRCSQCKKIHTELPDSMQPYKHYESASIQDTIDGIADNYCAAEESTLYRWKTTFKNAKVKIEALLIACWIYLNQQPYAILKTDSLLENMQSSIPRWLAFVMQMLINSGYTIHTQFAFCP